MQLNVLPDWRARGLICDLTQAEAFEEHLGSSPRTLYAGFDPTADSLHVGSLLPLLALRRAQLAGHRPIVLLGGGTGLIGDPSGKAGERTLNEAETVAAWTSKLKSQASQFVDFDRGSQAAIIVDNYEWIKELDAIGFLRDLGKHFPVGWMLAKESVRSRLGRDNVGLSYTEFSYMILQAYDYLSLYRRHGCTVQLGGSDQWGNILAGVELARRVDGAGVHGLTVPLVTKSDNTKFGKTESGTIWLHPDKTSPYEMYQFWLNTADADVVKFLKFFTFLPLEAIGELEHETQLNPARRQAQLTLAQEVTRLVHGADKLRDAERITSAFFGGDVKSLTADELGQVVRSAPATVLAGGDAPTGIVELLVHAGVAPSRARGRELVTSGSITVNGERVTEPRTQLTRADALFGEYVIIRKGKKTHHVIKYEH
jgi:tyrosyl-tRNA synthetase